jgi:hypothetical protein
MGRRIKMTNPKEMSNEELLDDLLSDHIDLLIDNYLSPIKRNLIKGNLDNKKTELLSRYRKGEKAIEAMKQIGELVYNCSCHSDTSNEVSKIFMEYIK